ncbi:SRPBCC family protein [Paeniglutamicibacter sp. MACA_103]|uniref:SRPBCC family protein n=1 Tax=Paeniglutamicibacter sp. MACA_103 TaxID=3377337 RepID=UPI00389573F6
MGGVTPDPEQMNTGAFRPVSRSVDRVASAVSEEDTMDIEATATINCPVARVWDFCVVHHAENHPRWDPDIRLEQRTEGPVAKGTVFDRWNSRYQTPTAGRMEVTGFDPERSMHMLIQDGPITTRGRFVLAPDGPDRTRLTIGGEFPGMDDSMAEKIRPLMQRSLETIRGFLE